MAIEDILGGVFPIQKFTSEAAANGLLGGLPQMLSGMGENEQMGLLGLLGPQFLNSGGGGSQGDPYAAMRPDQFLTGGEGPNQFASQTPGAPSMQNRGSQQMDPLSLLDQNINRRFGM